jgi:hypothetical protein
MPPVLWPNNVPDHKLGNSAYRPRHSSRRFVCTKLSVSIRRRTPLLGINPQECLCRRLREREIAFECAISVTYDRRAAHAAVALAVKCRNSHPPIS